MKVLEPIVMGFCAILVFSFQSHHEGVGTLCTLFGFLLPSDFQSHHEGVGTYLNLFF